jgi:hypothetical protein
VVAVARYTSRFTHDQSTHCLYLIFKSMQNDPVVGKSSELMRLGLMPSLEDLRAGNVCVDWCHGKPCLILTFVQDLLSVDISTASTLQKVAA